MNNTLILNTDAQPLSIVPLSSLTWQDAVSMEWLDRADVLAEYEDWIVRSPSIELQVPAVMMLRDYVKVSREIKFSRYNVFLRDLFTCQYCGKDMSAKPFDLTLDHVVPRQRGGKTRWNNVVACCGPCNAEKAHFDKMKPRSKPAQPSYWNMVEKRKLFPVAVPHHAWIEYLGWDESLVALRK